MIKVLLSTCSVLTPNYSTFCSAHSFALQVKKFLYLWFGDSKKDDPASYKGFNVQGQTSLSKISPFSTVLNCRFHREEISSVVHA